MKLQVLAAGKLPKGPGEAWVRDACAEYERRLSRHLPTELVEVRDSASLEGRIPPRFRVVALDERGKQPSSVELSARLDVWRGSGVPGVVFLIGDADGIPRALVEKAHETLSLSRLTLPHRLARILLLEQLYRALSILRGEPYHRA